MKPNKRRQYFYNTSYNARDFEDIVINGVHVNRKALGFRTLPFRLKTKQNRSLSLYLLYAPIARG